MNRNNAPVRNPWYITIFFLTILAALVLVDSNRFADPDLFCHLYSGREIVEEQRIPKTDAHSFSVPGGKWIDYEWGARALFYFLYRTTGSGGLVVLRAILCIAVFSIVFLNALRLSGSVLISSLSTILCAVVSHRYFLFRPQLFTFLLLSLLIFILLKYSKERMKVFFLLPILFLIWTNLHGGFPLGLLVFALFILSEYIEERFFQSAIFIVSALATLINPYGMNLWHGILGTIFGAFTPEISEWKPVYEFSFSSMLWFYFFLFVFVLTFLASREKRLIDLVLFILLSYLSVTKVRFIPLMAIVLAPILARYLTGTMERITASGRPMMRIIHPPASSLNWIVLIFLVFPLILKGVQKEIHLSMCIFKSDYFQPVTAVKMLKENGASGNIMNEYDWGGYIHWELPSSRIFVDGRSDTVYPYETIKEWAYFVNGVGEWEEVLMKYGADSILIRTQHLVNEKLKGSGRWKLVYYDNICSFYVNIESSRNANFLKKWFSDSLIISEISAKDYKL
ncbi:MAG: hypothetical protein AB1756_10430 [Acidobacteriota bacterium]